LSFVLALLAFGLLIAFHEFGHLVVALWAGMKVRRYSVGFGPVLVRRTIRGIPCELGAIPLGGFVEIAGLGGEEPDDVGAASFQRRPVWARLAAIAAGPAANYLLALVIGTAVLSVRQVSLDPSSTILGDVVGGGPAATAGLREGDDVRAVGQRAVTTFEALRAAVQAESKAHPGEPVPVAVVRAGQPMVVRVTPKDGLIGVTPHRRSEPGLPVVDAFRESAAHCVEATKNSVAMISSLVRRDTPVGALSGPVGIIGATAREARRGFLDYLRIVGELSIAVGFFNLLPVPALDGGRILIITLETVSRRKLGARVEGWINSAGFYGVVLLILFVTWRDVGRLVGG
jgi:regulator of sigma E protease